MCVCVCVWGGGRDTGGEREKRRQPSPSSFPPPFPTQLDQLATALALPPKFLSPQAPPADPARRGGGVIQCTASDATLVALLAARARVRARELGGGGAAGGDDAASTSALYSLDARLVIYTSDQAHAAVAKAAAVAGVHRVRLLPTTRADAWALAPGVLQTAMAADASAGLLPTLVVATIGTTSTGAFDPVAELAAVAAAGGAWLHVDAAWAGVAALCPDLRAGDSVACAQFTRGAFARAWAGLASVDSISTNMHKWGLTNFDCSPLWLADASSARAAFSPATVASFAPLASPTASLDLKDLQVPLGRRFRALKLWCVLRVAGLSGLRAHIKTCIALADRAAAALAADTSRFRLAGPPSLSLVCFKLVEAAPAGALAGVVARVNASGAAFLVTTSVGGAPVGRIAVGCPDTRAVHVDGVVAALAAAVDEERRVGGW